MPIMMPTAPVHLARWLSRGIALAVAIAGASPVVAQAPVSWRLSSAPRTTIGVDDTDPRATLHEVVGATRLSNGSILIGDRGDHAFLLFDANGRFVRSFARKGSGPGEVRYLGRMWRCGDSLYSYDIEEGHRISVFSLDGRYVRAFRFGSPQTGTPPYASRCNRAGVFAHIGWDRPREPKAGVHRSLVPLWLSGADSVVRRVIDSVPGSERLGTTSEGRITGSRPLPFGKQPVLAMGASIVYSGSADDFTVRRFDLTGKALSPLRRNSVPSPVTRRDIDHAILMETVGRSDSIKARIARVYAGMPLPKTMAAYSHLVIDANDWVWVRPQVNAGTTDVTWSVFNPSGALVAEVRVPALLEVFEIGVDYVLGRYVDPTDEIPHVRLYGLSRAAAARR